MTSRASLGVLLRVFESMATTSLFMLSILSKTNLVIHSQGCPDGHMKSEGYN